MIGLLEIMISNRVSIRLCSGREAKSIISSSKVEANELCPGLLNILTIR